MSVEYVITYKIMKMEIDLNDVFEDDYGSETIQESVKRQVIDKVANVVIEGVGKLINSEVSKVLDDEIKKAVQIQMPKIVDDLMNKEYTPVSTYGHSDQPTTFKSELVKSVQEQAVYKKTNYNSDKNAFTKAVDDIVNENISEFKTDFRKLVDANYKEEALEYAVNLLKEKLKV